MPKHLSKLVMVRIQELRGGKKPPLGSGERFARLQSQLKRRGARNPAALAAFIGRKKYGAKRFAQLSAQGRK